MGAAVTGSGCTTTQAPAAAQFDDLVSMTDDVGPISDEERWQRIDNAQRKMAAADIHAVFLDVGTSLQYFTDVRMWPSERMFAAVLPVDGSLTIQRSPEFEKMHMPGLIARYNGPAVMTDRAVQHRALDSQGSNRSTGFYIPDTDRIVHTD